MKGAVGMNRSLGEVARPYGDQAPFPVPPFHPNCLHPHNLISPCSGLLWRTATCLKPVAREDSWPGKRGERPTPGLEKSRQGQLLVAWTEFLGSAA